MWSQHEQRARVAVGREARAGAPERAAHQRAGARARGALPRRLRVQLRQAAARGPHFSRTILIIPVLHVPNHLPDTWTGLQLTSGLPLRLDSTFHLTADKVESILSSIKNENCYKNKLRMTQITIETT